MEKSTKIGLGLFLLVILGGYFFFNSDSDSTITGNVVQAGIGDFSGTLSGNTRHINIDAKRWDFGEDIRVKQGEDVMLMINNIDTTHGIFIPELNVRGNNVVTFTADTKGEFEFFCNTFCGSGHKGMTGKIIVE